MQPVRLGIVGCGNMGSAHISTINGKNYPNCQLTAICDLKHDKAEHFPKYKFFSDASEMIRSGLIDAILIATPHYSHTTIGIEALQAGLHVLVEKPISVHKADCEKLIAAHTNKDRVFAAMFNQRTDPYYIKLRELIHSGELGEIRRINWIVTAWFRPEIYYASGDWRATWAGEGGGVLLNQCPHNLDLLQWMFGMPKSVRAFCQLGKFHDIEVEDNVTAYFEYPNGATGVFVTTTGEAPGTNRLEVAAERGKVVIEDDKFTFIRNEIPTTEFSRTTKGSFSMPSTWNIDIPIRGGHGPQHSAILGNFFNAITKGEELIAPASEGIHSVELANAMLYSSFTNQTIDLPLDSNAYAQHLTTLIQSSKYQKKTVTQSAPVDMTASFR